MSPFRSSARLVGPRPPGYRAPIWRVDIPFGWEFGWGGHSVDRFERLEELEEELALRADAELRVGMSTMQLDGRRGDAELRCDRLAVVASKHQLHDLGLALGEFPSAKALEGS